MLKPQHRHTAYHQRDRHHQQIEEQQSSARTGEKVTSGCGISRSVKKNRNMTNMNGF